MEQLLAQQKALELKIDRTQVVREYWELILLKALYDSSFGRNFIFEGGTALRLAYGSPRFSEDLDFSLTKDVFKDKFPAFVEKLIVPYPELSLTDLESKRYTYLAEVKVAQNYLPFPFRIKLELSKRETKHYEWELKLLSSPASVVQVLGQVATLNQLYQDKMACLRGRGKPKDFFDLWYISGKLKVPYVPQKTSSRKDFVRDLRKYLPKDFWPIIEDLAR
jgi:predicted nucleotidyltransferase component of viral defense system